MGDGLKLSKDKRHRSSSSITGVVLEGTRSERKLEFRPSIAEVDDQFTLAEARCDDLQEKIDMVKVLKKKKKLKKRSTTRITDQQPPVEKAPFITVRTQPKRKLTPQAARLRRMEELPNPFRGYVDPATAEQHRMIGQVRGYNQSYKSSQQQDQKPQQPCNQLPTRSRPRGARADGDTMYGPGTHTIANGSLEVACGDDDLNETFGPDDQRLDHRYDDSLSISGNKKLAESRRQTNLVPKNRRRHVPRDFHEETSNRKEGSRDVNKTTVTRPSRANNACRRQQNTKPNNPEERPVVELFHKNHPRSADIRRCAQETYPDKNKKARDEDIDDDQVSVHLEDLIAGTDPVKELQEEVRRPRHPRKVKYRSRRYELPTVASQMKQAGVRYYYGTSNHTNIPFIVSKSTAPSHNIGVNIQQVGSTETIVNERVSGALRRGMDNHHEVLNGLKIQQPLSGIPLTIAYHMGLGHVPTYDNRNKPARPALDNREINAIQLGRKLLRLPSYKYMSYNRLLNMYREGDGMVPRFLRAINRPHYFYTSMYNLTTQREDLDGATSKGQGGNQEAKQSLAEYANLYREYEHIDKCIREGSYEPELERRREELTKELSMREEHIRRVVQDYKNGSEMEPPTLRASASTAEDGYRYSTFKLNLRDAQQ